MNEHNATDPRPAFDSRIEYLTSVRTPQPGAVLYWMRGAQRVNDNMALNRAAYEAHRLGTSLVVVYCLPPLNIRITWFVMQNMRHISESLSELGVPFRIYLASPPRLFAQLSGIGLVITESAYLRHHREWQQSIAADIDGRNIPMYAVDSEVLVPHSLVSSKQEYAAATMRRRITRQWMPYLYAAETPKECYMGPLADYLPSGARQPPARPAHKRADTTPTDKRTNKTLAALASIPHLTSAHLQAMHSPTECQSILHTHGMTLSMHPSPSSSFIGGEKEARRLLHTFLDSTFIEYGVRRNDPSRPVQSNLSAYLHHGMISIMRVAWQVVAKSEEFKQYPQVETKAVPDESLAAFLEESIVRRELAKNFTLYNPDYDTYKGIPKWAKETLEMHRSDPRPLLYSRRQLEQAQTADPYWNACQKEMVESGKMHGYMRMYWGKKVIEWTADPEEAFLHLVYLNDTYELDGCDENGYTGISWCFGTHDRPWFQRPIFGKVRYMNAQGLERKFNIQEYANKYTLF